VPFSEWGSVMIAKERETRSRRVAKESGARLRGRKGIVMTWQREVGKVAEGEKDREQSTWGKKSQTQHFILFAPFSCLFHSSDFYCLPPS